MIGAEMEQVAKLFPNGRSQAVRLPAAFRFSTDEVYIRQDAATGEVILSARPSTWDSFIAIIDKKTATGKLDDLSVARQAHMPSSDPFEGWVE
jgi:antitoxin VapB